MNYDQYIKIFVEQLLDRIKARFSSNDDERRLQLEEEEKNRTYVIRIKLIAVATIGILITYCIYKCKHLILKLYIYQDIIIIRIAKIFQQITRFNNRIRLEAQ